MEATVGDENKGGNPGTGTNVIFQNNILLDFLV